MFRILVFEEPFSVKFRLEGKLTSQTVPLLAQRWADARSGLKGRKAILDLGDVPEVDDAGRSTLLWLATSGVRMGYAHPRLRPMVAEVVEEARGDSKWSALVKQLRASCREGWAALRESEWYARVCAFLPAAVRPCGCRTA